MLELEPVTDKLSAMVLLCEAASVTLAVKEKLPVCPVVPAMVPLVESSVRPGGKPEDALQV